jgi:signal transduction histidine kinase
VEGSGTGLYLIKRIIENKNGRVEVESEVNACSEFKVFFASY